MGWEDVQSRCSEAGQENTAAVQWETKVCGARLVTVEMGRRQWIKGDQKSH